MVIVAAPSFAIWGMSRKSRLVVGNQRISTYVGTRNGLLKPKEILHLSQNYEFTPQIPSDFDETVPIIFCPQNVSTVFGRKANSFVTFDEWTRAKQKKQQSTKPTSHPTDGESKQKLFCGGLTRNNVQFEKNETNNKYWRYGGGGRRTSI